MGTKSFWNRLRRKERRQGKSRTNNEQEVRHSSWVDAVLSPTFFHFLGLPAHAAVVAKRGVNRVSSSVSSQLRQLNHDGINNHQKLIAFVFTP